MLLAVLLQHLVKQLLLIRVQDLQDTALPVGQEVVVVMGKVVEDRS